eukprot:scaffold11263_cov108-Isochrysis_galbana.AAC.7
MWVAPADTSDSAPEVSPAEARRRLNAAPDHPRHISTHSDSGQRADRCPRPMYNWQWWRTTWYTRPRTTTTTAAAAETALPLPLYVPASRPAAWRAHGPTPTPTPTLPWQ